MKCANPECGKEFSNFIGDQIIHNKIFCSKKCKDRVHVSKRNIIEKQKRLLMKIHSSCVRCGSIFNTFKKSQRFCSKECRLKQWKELHNEQYEISKRKWAKNNTDKLKLKHRKYVQSGRISELRRLKVKELTDSYIKERLGSFNVPKELIELKRTHLKLKRKIYEKK